MSTVSCSTAFQSEPIVEVAVVQSAFPLPLECRSADTQAVLEQTQKTVESVHLKGRSW
jgi:hypothetical protein